VTGVALVAAASGVVDGAAAGVVHETSNRAIAAMAGRTPRIARNIATSLTGSG
jgi:hypothetical protein